MEPNWAAEHLQVIRTLMERSAVYRRALAPIMLLLGILGIVAAGAGAFFAVNSIPAFGWYWMGVGVVGVSGAYFMVRRQALRDGEPFWSPPTRRVTNAALPAVVIGLVASVLLILNTPGGKADAEWLPPIWMVLYGCAIHAAGFFMPRGMKLFGWVFILTGCAAGMAVALLANPGSLGGAQLMMGIFFGGLHLAYGLYLYFTEDRKNEA